MTFAIPLPSEWVLCRLVGTQGDGTVSVDVPLLVRISGAERDRGEILRLPKVVDEPHMCPCPRVSSYNSTFQSLRRSMLKVPPAKASERRDGCF